MPPGFYYLTYYGGFHRLPDTLVDFGLRAKIHVAPEAQKAASSNREDEERQTETEGHRHRQRHRETKKETDRDREAVLRLEARGGKGNLR